MAPNQAGDPEAGRRITRSRSKPDMHAIAGYVKTDHSGLGKATVAGSNESTSSVPTPTSYLSGSEYATPLTSGAATPGIVGDLDTSTPSKLASSSSKLEITLQARRQTASRSQHGPPVYNARKAANNSIYSLNPASSGKKHRVVDDDDDYDLEESPDFVLAQKLQAEEYEKSSISVAGSSKAGTSRASNSVPGFDWSNGMDIDDSMDFISKKRKSTAAPKGASKKQKSIAGRAKNAQTLDADPSEDASSGLSSVSDSSDDGDLSDESDSSGYSDTSGSSTPATHTTHATPATHTTQAIIPAISVDAAARRRRGIRKRMKHNRDLLETFHPEIITMWTDLQALPTLNAGVAAQPTSISRSLKPFQLEGLAWLIAMEKTKWKGGLLGDEMGLGKTIQAVSLIMSDHPAKRPTLVLAPPVALMQWSSEIQSYTGGTLNAIVFHGTMAKAKQMTVKSLKQYDVIIMSYNSLESMYRKQEKGFKRKDGVYKEKSKIHQIQWHRVILDEAHSIKTRTTMTAKACFALQADYRWCLSGTPLQNRIGEFFSLVRFLMIRPFADYYCYDCPCAKIEWDMGDDGDTCASCQHSSVRHISVFNHELLNPITRWGNAGLGAEAFQKLRQLTKHIMLRRLKKDHMDSMELPIKEIIVDRQFFSEVENDFASSVMTSGQRQFNTYVAQGVLLNNYANIFGLIMKMRQVANHPDLILKKDSEGGQNILVCCICDESAEEAIRSGCKHDFCRSCAKSYVNSTGEPDCPRCHIPLVIDLEQPDIEQDEALVKKSSIINRIRMENWTSSTKIELLVHELYRLRSKNASHKSIVFSQFTTMLQLLEWRLRRAGITTVMLDGSMTPAQRQASIDHFMTNADVECFLVSLKAGGVALNLTEASRVFIVDPWWNPAAEWQSADRCHRIGQTRPCIITRLCIEDSVESRMVLLQEKKAKMIKSTINSDDAAMDSLSRADLQFLFRGN